MSEPDDGIAEYERLFLGVLSSNKRLILEELESLKNDPKCPEIVLRGDSLEQLIKLLAHRDYSVLVLTLSVLADVCRSAEVRRKTEGTKIVKQILWMTSRKDLQERFRKNTMPCMVGRLIGNLCKSSHHARTFYEADVVSYLTSFLNENPFSPRNKFTAVRTTRILWEKCEESRENFVNQKAVMSVMQIFEETTNSSEPKDLTDLAEECLKAFKTFLQTPCPLLKRQMQEVLTEVGNQLQGSKDKCGYRALINHCRHNNKLAIECLYRLYGIPNCRADASKCGAIEAIIELLLKGVVQIRLENRAVDAYAIGLLHQFCCEPNDRYRVRTSKGLELILTLMKEPRYQVYHSTLMHALTKFIYDENGFAIMVEGGLLEVIVDKLKKMKIDDKLNSSCEEIEEKVGRKRHSESLSDIESRQCGHKKSRFNSSCLSSILTIEDGVVDDSTKENFNPDYEDDCKLVDDKDGKDRTVNRTIDYSSLILLRQLSCLKSYVENLADPYIIKFLTLYIRKTNNTDILRILVRIIGNKFYFSSIIKQGYVLEVQRLTTIMDEFKECIRELSTVARTGGALGELTTMLQREQENLEEFQVPCCKELPMITAISIPFIVPSKFNLRYLLIDHKGLDLIFKVLQDHERHLCLYEAAVWSICQLATSLEIHPDTLQFTNGIVVYDSEDEDMTPCHKMTSVTFELDDGSTVDACRRTLCRRSAFFRAMLEGPWKESSQKVVHIGDASRDGLGVLLFALDGTGGEARLRHADIEGVLDALKLARKYVMFDIVEMLTESLQVKIDYQNFSKAWNWARRNFQEEDATSLKMYCIKTFLSMDMKPAERTKAFLDFAAYDSFSEFLDEVRHIIEGELLKATEKLYDV